MSDKKDAKIQFEIKPPIEFGDKKASFAMSAYHITGVCLCLCFLGTRVCLGRRLYPYGFWIDGWLN